MYRKTEVQNVFSRNREFKSNVARVTKRLFNSSPNTFRAFISITNSGIKKRNKKKKTNVKTGSRRIAKRDIFSRFMRSKRRFEWIGDRDSVLLTTETTKLRQLEKFTEDVLRFIRQINIVNDAIAFSNVFNTSLRRNFVFDFCGTHSVLIFTIFISIFDSRKRVPLVRRQ